MSRQPPVPDFLRPRDVAARLSISVRQVGRLIAAGKLVAVWDGHCCLIPVEAYDAYRAGLLTQAPPTLMAMTTPRSRGRPPTRREA